MSPQPAGSVLERFERALAEANAEPYALTLFVSGASDSSARAISSIRQICDEYLSGRHHLKIVDLNQEPNLAAEHQVLATPTLIKTRPLPACILVGDMSDEARILSALHIEEPARSPLSVTTPGRVRSKL